MQRAGHAVVEAADARQAIALLDIERPDVVLLDLGLPDRDGLEMIGLIRLRSTAIVIVVSARDDGAEKVTALDLGADDYVTKPFYRSEERRVGKESVSTCRSRWSPYHSNKNKQHIIKQKSNN